MEANGSPRRGGTSVRVQVFGRDGYRCLYCLRAVWSRGRGSRDPRRRATVDHVIPKSEGGKYATTNLVTACADCNCRRGTKPVLEFAGREAMWRVRRALEASRKARRALNGRDDAKRVHHGVTEDAEKT